MAIRFKSVDSSVGRVAVVMDDGFVVANLTGTHLMVPARTGIIAAPLSSVAAAILGTYQLNSSRVGTIAAALANISAEFRSAAVPTWVIPAGTSTITFNGGVSSHPGVTGPSRPAAGGDVIGFAPGVHGKRIIENVVGGGNTDRIRFQNSAGGQTIFRLPAVGGSFDHEINACMWIDWVGDVAGASVPLHPLYGTPMGFKWTFPTSASTSSHNYNPVSMLKFNDVTERIRMSHFEVDGGWSQIPSESVQTENGSIAIQTNHNTIQRADNPGRFQRQIEFGYFLMRRVGGEGIYFGPNWSNGALPLENTEVHHFLCEDIGADAVNCKSHIRGVNSVHDGVVRRACRSASPAGTPSCVSILSSTMKAWNLKIFDGGRAAGPVGNGDGLSFFTQNGPVPGSPEPGYPNITVFDIEAFNIVSARNLAKGVTAGNQGGTVPPRAKLYSITAVDNADNGVATGSGSVSGGFIKNCIALRNGASQINAGGGTADGGNTTTGNPDTMFLNAAGEDFRLAQAVAIVAGSALGIDVSANDIDGVLRVLANADRGAHERAP